MRGHLHLGSCSRKEKPRRCNVKGKFDDVVFIDDDPDRLDDVVIIDGDSIEQKPQDFGVNKGKIFPYQVIIRIDDDDDDTGENPEIRSGGGGELDSDASSSGSRPLPNFKWKSSGFNDDDCWVIREKNSAFRLSKCKQAASERPPCGKKYGLSSESVSSSSESDCSDCELVEGSIENLCKQWETASKRRKTNVAKSGLEDQGSASGSRADTPQSVEVENRTKQCTEIPVCSCSNDPCFQEKNFTTFTVDGSNVHSEKQSPQGPHFWLNQENFYVERDFVRTSFSDVDQNIRDENSNLHSGVQANLDPCASNVSESLGQKEHLCKTQVYDSNVVLGEMDQEVFMRQCNHLNGKKVSHPVVSLRHGDQEVSQVPSTCKAYPNDLPHENSSREEKKLESEDFSASDSIENIPKDGSTTFGNTFTAVSGHSPSSESQSSAIPEVAEGNFERGKPPLGEIAQSNETATGQSRSTEAQKQCLHSMPNGKVFDERDPNLVQGGDTTHSCQGKIVTDREKLKETEEYKRAEEAEWASRLRELQLQSEKVQKLRKRKKAENMRLLDMEKRQKQRLEEMRETQKKDEENMNLKEQLRMEVRKELSKLELSCIDMASLLRSLGIFVGGGFHPSSDEVHAAYKRALLRFHPDRASRTDIQRQVEAEEKFKLISRMKEKYV